MKAITKTSYGGPEILRLREVEQPQPKAGEILVKVAANSANPADWHIIRGEPFFARFSSGLFKPKELVPGADFAGVVVGLGAGVSQFKVGDRVFGETLHGGAFAEYLCAPVGVCANMPATIGFAEMACLPIAGLTALQAITTHGKLQAGETVLINGASGGVGHFAVQIAKAYGAQVTAVCSAKNVAFVQSLGADVVIAYDQENIHEHAKKYDLVIDTNGNLFFSDFKRMGKRGVLIGFTGMGHMMNTLLTSAFSKFSLKQFTAAANNADLTILAGLMERGKIRVHIERTYSYDKIPEAIALIENMRTRGKVAMFWP